MYVGYMNSFNGSAAFILPFITSSIGLNSGRLLSLTISSNKDSNVVNEIPADSDLLSATDLSKLLIEETPSTMRYTLSMFN